MTDPGENNVDESTKISKKVASPRKNMQVVVRIRPLNTREIEGGDKSSCKLSSKDDDQKTIRLIRPESSNNRGNRGPKSEFRFDSAYGPKSETTDVYEDIVQGIVKSSMEGINGTIMAYGQTSSGKTFTMSGTHDCPGIIPLATMDIFSLIHEEPDREFLLRVSMCEVYNEEVRDLLNPNNSKELVIRKDRLRVTSVDDVMALLEAGGAQRTSGMTRLNSDSSRSHAIFRVIIENSDDENNSGTSQACVNVSSLTLVDLAGSERSKKTGATGARFREGNNINKSLMNLGVVIRKLSEKAASVGAKAKNCTFSS
eukprot:GSMAST32.ASY1.ANO1.1883.1 assembled CDS